MGSALSCARNSNGSSEQPDHQTSFSKQTSRQSSSSPAGFQVHASASKPQRSCPQYGKEGYLVSGQLGSEQGSTMKLMRIKKTKQPVAGKWIPREKGKGLSKSTEREIVNHKKLNHPNIIAFKEVYLTDDHLVIVMEYASGGPLEDRINTAGPCSEEDAKKLFRQLIDGLTFCHKQGIFHRSLRMDNMLLEGSHFNSVLKISNFGYSKSSVLDSEMNTKGFAAPAYSSPELLAGVSGGASYDGAAVDVWAAGCILFAMLAGRLPFVDAAEPHTINKRVMNRISEGRFRLPSRVQVSPACLHLLRQIFNPDPKLRIKTEDIKSHPWLSGTDGLADAGDSTAEQAEQTEDDIISVVQRARAWVARRRSNEPSPRISSS